MQMYGMSKEFPPTVFLGSKFCLVLQPYFHIILSLALLTMLEAVAQNYLEKHVALQYWAITIGVGTLSFDTE